MNGSEPDWIEANQRTLTAAIDEVRAALQSHAGREAPAYPGTETAAPGSASPSALDILCAAFGLSRFERAVLLLCAGVELDGQFPGLCAATQGDPARPFPTFSLALAALPDPHWSALTPL